MVESKLIPLDEAKIRKEELYVIPWLKEQFPKGDYDIFRLQALFTDFLVMKKFVTESKFGTETKSPVILIESKEYMDRKNFYTAILELLACEKTMVYDSSMDDYLVAEKIIVCKKFYNKIKSKTKTGVRIYDNATFKKILDLFDIKVIEIGGKTNVRKDVRKEKGR